MTCHGAQCSNLVVHFPSLYSSTIIALFILSTSFHQYRHKIMHDFQIQICLVVNSIENVIYNDKPATDIGFEEDSAKSEVYKQYQNIISTL